MSCRPAQGLLGLALAMAGAACADEALLLGSQDLCVRPETLDFGAQEIRTTSSRTLAATNCGKGALAQLTTTVTAETDDDANAFLLVATPVPEFLGESEHVLLPVRFRPTEVRDYTATLTFAFVEEPDRAISTVSLAGTGAAPATCAPALTPDSHMFPTTDVGQTVTTTFTLANDGLAACAVNVARIVDGNDHFAVTVAPPSVLDPGASAPIEVRYAPRTEATHTAELSVVIDGALDLRSALSGDGLLVDACALAARPVPVVFPRTSLTLPGTTAGVEIENVGVLDCTLADFTITAGQGDFTVIGAPPPGTLLAPGGVVSATLEFVPATVGSRSGTLTVSAVEGALVDVPLSGFADPRPICALRFDPSPATFSPVAVGLASEQDIVITNSSSIDCELTALAVAADTQYSLVGGPPLGVLPAAQSVGVRVRYSPVMAAPALGRLDVEIDATATQSNDLIGFADYAELVLTPSLLHFGFVTEGCASQTQTIYLTNVGPVAARVDRLAWSPSTDPNFELLTPMAPDTMLAAGQDVPLWVRMIGVTSFGGQSGELRAHSTGTLAPMVRTSMFGTSESIADASRVDVFIQVERPTVDILFVIDNSGSMSQEQANLAANFDAFIQFFTSAVDVDYHIGVTTTDTATNGDKGALVGPYIHNGTPDPVAEFTAQANVGTSGSATEKGLEASALAVEPPNTSVGGPNDGFLREDSLLSVVYVSDENDQSPGAVSEYVDRLLAAKGYDTRLFIASAIAGDVPSGCATASTGPRYLDITLSTGGIFASICAPDWSTTMEQLGFNTFAALTRFELTRTPDPSSAITVLVDGVPVPMDPLNGWTYDSSTNTIVFHGTSVPAAGQEIEVHYTAECLPI